MSCPAERLVEIREKMRGFGDGSCAIVRVDMGELPNGDRLKHLMIAEQVDGRTMLLDPMSGTMQNDEIITMSSNFGTSLFRVDELEFTSLFLECCEVL